MTNEDSKFIPTLDSLKDKRIGSVCIDNTLKGEIYIKFNEEKSNIGVEFNGINGIYAIKSLLNTIIFILKKGKITNKEDVYEIIFNILETIDFTDS